jgi:hypothetical protein
MLGEPLGVTEVQPIISMYPEEPIAPFMRIASRWSSPMRTTISHAEENMYRKYAQLKSIIYCSFWMKRSIDYPLR